MSDKHSVTGWRKDPFTAIFLGLAMTLVGILWFMINRGYIEDQEWWPFAISGAGCILIAECFLARMASPDHRRPMFGRLLVGIILVCVGVSIAFDIREWWPVIPIIVGSVFTLFGIQEMRRSS